MTDIAVPTTSPPPAAHEPVDLLAFAQEASAVHKIAQALARSSFVPKAFQDRPDEITGAILFGRELHLHPMVALQEIHVIQGRPTMSANSMRGVAMFHGVEFEILEESDTKVVMRARNPRQEKWTTATWTIDRARKMDLLKKDNWSKQPQAMLNARCTSELCRKVAANVLIGLPYSTEELADLADVPLPATVTPPEHPPAKTVRRKTPAYEAPGVPELEPAPTAEPEPQEVASVSYSPVDEENRTSPEPPTARPNGISPLTRKALMAVFGDLNMRERNTRLAYVSDVVGREVHSVNQLTDTEGRDVIKRAHADLAEQGWPAATEVPQ